VDLAVIDMPLHEAIEPGVRATDTAVRSAAAQLGMRPDALAFALSIAHEHASTPARPMPDVDALVAEAVLAERSRLSTLLIHVMPTVGKYAADAEAAIGLCALLLRLEQPIPSTTQGPTNAHPRP
jgi:hypothetical protein